MFVFVLLRSIVSDGIVQWKLQGSTECNHRFGRLKKLIDRDLRTVKRIARNNRQSGLSTIAEEFRRSSGTEVSDRTIRREVLPRSH